jgi:Domain of unknown function (DUF929)
MTTEPRDRKRLTKKQRKRLKRQTAGAPAPRWRSTGALGGAAFAIVALIVVIFVVLGSRSSGAPSPGLGSVPAAVLSAVTRPNPDIVAAVGTGGQPGNLNRVNGDLLKGQGGKPMVVYVGAEFCPYCAAERWSLVMALSRFGSISNLQEMTSSSTDVDPNTSTFTFHNSSYSSSTIDFQTAELEDRNQQPLESPSAQISQIFNSVDKPPFTANAQGFPFLDIAGRFVLNSSSYDPSILQGLSWEQIASDLSQPGSPVTKAIVGNANYITAAICVTTGNQPAGACSSPVIQSIESTLSHQAPVG